MAQSSDNHAQAFIARKQKNLEFFRRVQPALGDLLARLEMKRVEVVVSPDEPDLDIAVDGQSLYGGQARSRSLREVDQFLGSFGDPPRLNTYKPVGIENFQKPRYAESQLAEGVEASPVRNEAHNGFILGKSLPQVVFLGVGAGYHIEALLKRVDVTRVLIYEPDPEVFSASLFTVDWPSIVSEFSKTKGKAISFIVGTGQPEAQLEAQLQAFLANQVPFFPLLTVFFNHRGLDKYNGLVGKARENARVSLSSWGNYDNELYRLNNSRHNLSEAFRTLCQKPTQQPDRPVLVVGSGPSIDHRIDDIKAVRDKAMVVSAGTGLRALINNGIEPDFHVELDPILQVYEMQQVIGREKLKNTVLLAASEVHPFVTRLFGSVIYYFRADSMVSRFLAGSSDCFEGTTPTCVNAAVSLFSQLGFRNLFLFGVDFGYEDPEQHHASDSAYGRNATTEYEKGIRQRSMESFGDDNTFRVPSVTGGEVITRSQYFAAKQFLNAQVNRHAARWKESEYRIRNCSDGALIERVPWFSKEDFKGYFEQLDGLEPTLISLETEPGDSENAQERLGKLGSAIGSRVNMLMRVARGSRLKGRRDLLLMVSRMMNQLEAQDRSGEKNLGREACQAAYQLLRGTLWQFFTIGLTHGLSLDGKEQTDFLKGWHKRLTDFLDGCESHFRAVIERGEDVSSDGWLRQYLSDPEDARRDVTPPG